MDPTMQSLDPAQWIHRVRPFGTAQKMDLVTFAMIYLERKDTMTGNYVGFGQKVKPLSIL